MKRMIASRLVLSESALTMSVRTVCPRSEGTSLPRAKMRIFPSLSSRRPNGGAAGCRWFGFCTELADKSDNDVVRARTIGRIGDRVLRGGILQSLKFRV